MGLRGAVGGVGNISILSCASFDTQHVARSCRSRRSSSYSERRRSSPAEYSDDFASDAETMTGASRRSSGASGATTPRSSSRDESVTYTDEYTSHTDSAATSRSRCAALLLLFFVLHAPSQTFTLCCRVSRVATTHCVHITPFFFFCVFWRVCVCVCVCVCCHDVT